MTSQIQVLIKMQKIDDKISEKEAVKVKLPQQLNSLVLSVKNAEEELDTIKKKIEDIQLRQKNKEAEIKSNNDLIKKYEHQLEGIKNNKEYKALNSQISLLQDKNTQIENEILNIMDEEAQVNQKLNDALNNKKNADSNLQANESLLNKEIEKVEVEINQLKDSRTELAKQIPMTIVKKYVQLIKNKNRKAVVFNSNNACSGCGFHIRPQILIDLKENNKSIYCENCGRILVNSMD